MGTLVLLLFALLMLPALLPFLLILAAALAGLMGDEGAAR
jgi:hypothetical protein